jgi:CRISPR-associated protein Csx14
MNDNNLSENTATLVATLGGQPQLITFTLDLLLDRGEQIDQVVVIYLANKERYRKAQIRLAREFPADRYRGQVCRLRTVPVASESPLTEEKILLAEAITPDDVEAVRNTIYSLLAALKVEGRRIHLSLSGGRRIMALTALSAAMLYLKHSDQIWHIYTPDSITAEGLQGDLMHVAPGSGLQLIEVPFVPWATYFPGLKPLLETSPLIFRSQAPGWLDETDQERCAAVWKTITPRQKDVLHLLAKGKTRKEAAAELNIQVCTVETHQKAIIGKCRRVWADQLERFDLQFIRQYFGAYLARIAPV